MVGKQLGDAPVVYRFVRGHYYHVESFDPSLQRTYRIRVLVYLCRSNTASVRGHTFLKLFDSMRKPNNVSSYVVLLSKNMPSYSIKEVQFEDLPVYMGMHTYPTFKEVMAGTFQEQLSSARKRKKMRKIRRQE